MSNLMLLLLFIVRMSSGSSKLIVKHFCLRRSTLIHFYGTLISEVLTLYLTLRIFENEFEYQHCFVHVVLLLRASFLFVLESVLLLFLVAPFK